MDSIAERLFLPPSGRPPLLLTSILCGAILKTNFTGTCLEFIFGAGVQSRLHLPLETSELRERLSQCFIKKLLGAVAQLGERLHGMQEVRGSIPLSSMYNKASEVTSSPFFSLNNV